MKRYYSLANTSFTNGFIFGVVISAIFIAVNRGRNAQHLIDEQLRILSDDKKTTEWT